MCHQKFYRSRQLAKLNRYIMTKYIYKAGTMFAFMPFMAMPTANFIANIGSLNFSPVTKVEISADDIRAEKAQKIDTYFKERSMPLEGKGLQFVLVAEKYGLDYNLLPAIAVRESSGGKAACGFNPFGWGSCHLDNFRSYDEAIETLGSHLGGAKKSTARYYAGKNNLEKLYFYNGTVIPAYPAEVLAIMDKINTIETDIN